MTGEYSYFTTFEEHDIMYHVSTLLPFSSDDRQQVITLPTHLPVNQYLNLQPGIMNPHSHFCFKGALA
jgi:hypothetical protein